MHFLPLLRRLPRWQLSLGAAMGTVLLTLTACGGGSSNVSTVPTGRMALSVTDGPSTDFTSAFITINHVTLHTDATAVDMTGEPGWFDLYFPGFITIDLNHLNNGVLAAALSAAQLPAGTYGQIRLGFAPWDVPLKNSAAATQVYGQPLQYNSTVVEADGTQYPLEIATPAQSIVLTGNFTVTANQTLNLAIEFNAGDDIVKFRHGASGHAYVLNPTLRAYDLDHAGAITGQVNCSPNCASFVVKAEELSADHSHYQVARWTNVDATGHFTLYPVPVRSNSQTYDLVVRGHNARTMVIQSVPAVLGTTPNQNPTNIPALAVYPASEYTATTSAATPKAVSYQFYQSLAGSAPYEIRIRQTDPFTGTFMTAEPLVNGDVLVGTYQANAAPNFSAVTPDEGSGAYQVWLNAPYFTRTQATTVNAGATSVTPPGALTLGNGVSALGHIAVHLTASRPGNWNRGQLVITRQGAIVNTLDISAQVGNGGDVTIDNLPSGSTAQPFPLGYYFAHLRLWNSTDETAQHVNIVPIAGHADMRRTDTAALTATLP